jgi:hypothetical protein
LAALGLLAQGQAGDQVAAQDEEDGDPEEPGEGGERLPLDVAGNDEQDGEGSQAVQLRGVRARRIFGVRTWASGHGRNWAGRDA